MTQRVFVHGFGGRRYYRTEGDNRISDADGYWFSYDHLSLINTRPSAFRQGVGETGSRFLKSLAETPGLKFKELFIISAWQFTIHIEDAADLVTFDRLVLSAIERATGTSLTLEAETRSVDNTLSN